MMCIRHSSVSIAFLLLLLLDTTLSYAPLSGVKVKSIVPSTEQTKQNDNNLVEVDLGEYLQSSSSLSRTMLIFGTYAADFNAIEYAQRLRYYLPRLRKECQITKFGLILNSDIGAARSLCHAVDLPTYFHSSSNKNNDNLVVDIFIDPTGNAGKKFGVNRGWLPNNPSISPYVKLFGMLLGLGAWATLPAVIGGYLGNPFVPQPWIEDALVVGTKQGRWPDNAIQITKKKASSQESSTMDNVDQPQDSDEYSIQNQFEKLPWFGSWKRRPLELATLRLQSMLGISLQMWDELSPNQEGMDSGVLTQLGGLLIYESSPTTTGQPLLEWRDPGICAVANFEDIIPKLSV